MTSDKSGPVRTATPALDEDLETTRVRKGVTGEQAPAETPETKPAGADSGKSSASTKPAKTDADVGTGSDGAASAEGDSGPTVPTTGGIWQSAYEAGQSGTEPTSSDPATPSNGEAKAPQGLVSAIDRVSTKTDAAAPQSVSTQEPGTSAKSWNRVSAPSTPPGPPAPLAESADGVRAGAMKAAQAALDAARSAAKKVSSIMPDDEGRATATPSAATDRPKMHYTAGGVRGTATPEAAPTGASAAAAGSQASTQPASAPTPEVPHPAPAGPRRVRLAVSRVDPWSVMKLAFLLAVAIAIMTVVATAVFWSVLDGFGVFTTVQDFVEDAVGPQSNVNLTQFVEFPRVISLATLVSICNIVLLTAIATIMAFLYNITAALVGGVHMTLTDD